MLLCSITSAAAQVSVGIGLPGVSIGINLPVYPQLVPVPGYPVYYAPQVNSNYFFYDGMYWVYQRDNWYASSWYNGPWELVAPEAVPLFVLRVPVRYYRQPPAYFRGWRSDAPPRWGEHWGNAWEQRQKRMGQLGSQFRTSAGPAACLPAAIFRESISARGAAAGAAKPELPLPAARRRSAAALSGAASAKRARAFAAGKAGRASGKKLPRSRTNAAPARHLHSSKALHRSAQAQPPQRAAETFRGRPSRNAPPQQSRPDRAASEQQPQQARPSVSSRRQGASPGQGPQAKHPRRSRSPASDAATTASGGPA